MMHPVFRQPFQIRFQASRALPFALLMSAAAACAQQVGGSGGATQVSTSASVTQSITNNALLSSTDRRSDVVTQLSAGISLGSRRGRVQGSLDYQLTGSIHARGTEANNTANSLRAAMRAEVLDNWMFLDASAMIGQQSISAFGVQSDDLSVDSPNRTEVRSYTVTPSVRGRVGTWANYSAQLSHTQQSSAAGSAGDTTGDTATVALSSAGASRIGWSLVGSRQRSDFDAGRSSTTDSFRGGLNYTVNSELRLSANGGREHTDVLTPAGENTNTWGWGVDWIPSERTSLSARRDHRFFGEAHNLSFNHRMARSNWRFSSSRDVSTASPSLVTGTVTYYDLLFANLATLQPDPELRRQLVLQELARQGYNPTAVAGSISFLTSALTLVSRQEFSFALQGVRSSVTFSLYRSDSRRLDVVATAVDDLSSASSVRQHGFSATLGHRLTPISGLTLTLSKQSNRGATLVQSNDLQSINLNWSSQLGLRSNVSLGARHVDFDSMTAPYTESAIFATWSVRF